VTAFRQLPELTGEFVNAFLVALSLPQLGTDSQFWGPTGATMSINGNDNFDSNGRSIGPGGFSPGHVITPSTITHPQTVYPPKAGTPDSSQTNYRYDVVNGGKK